ncbi:MAG: NAD(P)-dependent oxidoreductase [Bacteroidota bacterium]
MTVAFLGLGAMGRRMAAHVLAAGHDLTVWNRTPARADALTEAGATRADTPREAASGAEIVVACVRDDIASREVWLGPDGALAGLADEAIAVEASTLTPGWVREWAEAVGAARCLDAPVVGSRPQAEAQALVSLVGGRTEAVQRARPVLETWSGAVRHAGEIGAGATLKLAVNALFAIQAAAFAETLGALTASGVDLQTAADFLGRLPITSPAAARLVGLMAAGTFAPNFPVGLVEKDLGYAVAHAEAVGASVPVAAGAREAFARAVAEGYHDDDIAGVAQVFL